MINHLPVQIDQLHHAYLIRGRADGLFEYLGKVFGVDKRGHPDLYYYACETLSIDTARMIREAQARRPVQAARTLFVIEASDINIEAQHALLKVFEDPAASTIFFLVLPRDVTVLSTLLSRVQTIETENGPGVRRIDAALFLSQPPHERLTTVAPIFREKDSASAQELIQDIEILLHERWIRDKDTAYKQALQELAVWRDYVYDRGASLRILMEHCALTLPIIDT